MDVIEQQTEALDLHTNTLQILLGKVHLQWRRKGESDDDGLCSPQRRLCCSALTWPPASGY